MVELHPKQILSEMKFYPQICVIQIFEICLNKNLNMGRKKRENIFYKKAKYIQMQDHFAV